MIVRIIFFFGFMRPLLAQTVSTSNVSKLPISGNETWVDKLRHDILKKYDKWTRPTEHCNKTTLYVHLSIFHVEIDSKKSMMTVNSWVHLNWDDAKLKWRPENYGGIKDLTLRLHDLWLPDLYLYNSALHETEDWKSRQCTVHYDGEVTSTASTIFFSYCELNLILWPFETNICVLNLGSWSHNGNEIDVKFKNKGYDLQHYTGGEWKILNISAHRRVHIYSCCPEPYIILDYYFKISRISELNYHIVFIVPIPILFMVLITFWLKPQSEIKLVLNICAIIINILILLYFGLEIPPKIESMPLIVTFFSSCLLQVTISMIISSFVIHISTTFYNRPIPRRIKSILYDRYGRYFGLCNVINEIENQKFSDLHEPQDNRATDAIMSSIHTHADEQSIISQSRNVMRLEWLLLATFIDRVSFILNAVVFVFTALAYIRLTWGNFLNKAE
ncbi:hypothetical protein TKK_0009750 [Trichogramma kaykai]|uniref:Neurotransmitter-gated ion-channel ligand-binding domain-containing protein n=1 Tax=Trichogramma kaykai TaxID=54128 RepID=A0ABD2X0C9_9HYME